eukprot:scaffold2767_cov177-Amphora_coffeaeformis.AAC.95
MPYKRDEDYSDSYSDDQGSYNDDQGSFSDEQGSYSGSYDDEDRSCVSDLPQNDDPIRPTVGKKEQDKSESYSENDEEPDLFDATPTNGFDTGSAFGKMFAGDDGFGGGGDDVSFGFDTTSKSKKKGTRGFDRDANFDDFGFGCTPSADKGDAFGSDAFGSADGDVFGFGDAGGFGGGAFGGDFIEPNDALFGKGDDDEGSYSEDNSGKDPSVSQDHSGSQDRSHSGSQDPDDYSGSQDDYSDRSHSQSSHDHSGRPDDDHSGRNHSGKLEDHSGREEDLSGRDDSFSRRKSTQREEEDFSERDHSVSEQDHSERDGDFSGRKDGSYSGQDYSGREEDLSGRGSVERDDDFSGKGFSGRDDSAGEDDFSRSVDSHSGREDDMSGRGSLVQDGDFSEKDISNRDEDFSGRDESAREDDYSRSAGSHSGRGDGDLSGKDVSNDDEGFSAGDNSAREDDHSGSDGSHSSHKNDGFPDHDNSAHSGEFSGQDASNHHEDDEALFGKGEDLSGHQDDFSAKDNSASDDYSRSDGSLPGQKDDFSYRDNSVRGDFSGHDASDRHEDDEALFGQSEDLSGHQEDFSGRDDSAPGGDYSGRDGSLSERDQSGHGDFSGRDGSYSDRDESGRPADDTDALFGKNDSIPGHQEDFSGREEDFPDRDRSAREDDFSGHDSSRSGEHSARLEDHSGHGPSISGRDHSGRDEEFSDHEHSGGEGDFSAHEKSGHLHDSSERDDSAGRDDSYSDHEGSNPADFDTDTFGEVAAPRDDDLSGSQEDSRGSYSENKEDSQGGFEGKVDFGFDRKIADSMDMTAEDSGPVNGFQGGFDDDMGFGGSDDFGFAPNPSASDDFKESQESGDNDPAADAFGGGFGDDMGFGEDNGFEFDNKADEPANVFDDSGFGGWGAENGLVQPANSANQFGNDMTQSVDSTKSKDDAKKSTPLDLDPASDEESGDEDGSNDNASIDIDDIGQPKNASTRNKQKALSSGGKTLSPTRPEQNSHPYGGQDDDDSNYSGGSEGGADEDESIDDSAYQTTIDQNSRDFGGDTLADTLDDNTGHTGALGFDSQENLDLGDDDKDDFYVSMSELKADMDGQGSSPKREEKIIDDERGDSSHSQRSDPEHPEQEEDLPPVELNIREKLASRPGKPASYKRYTREQMLKLTAQNSDGKKKKKKSKQKKPEELLDFVANVNEVILFLDQMLESGEAQPDSDSELLLNGFESLVGIFLQISDEKELMATFAKGGDKAAVDALDSLLKFVLPVNEIFLQLRPVIEHYFTHDTDEEMNDLLYGMNLMVDLLCELAHKIGDKQEWNQRACTAYATLVELLARDTLEVASIYDDVDTPEYELSVEIEDAWNGTGHIEEFQTLEEAPDLAIFRQICYEVILSTDKWCPDTETLMNICGIEDVMLDEASDAEDVDESELAVPPETAIQVLDKINGEPLRRPAALASVLRRVLPGNKISDKSLAEHLTSIRSAMRSPLGLPASNLIGITSIPEVASDPEALGVAGVGKTTLAALVANHRDVRRHFCDGIAWIHLGQKELNYTRYIQCLRDLISQLEVPEEEEPAFPELLRTPSETGSQRRRREEGFLVFVRETMIAFLKKRCVLVILDDVCFESDLDWFDFGAPSDDPDDEVSSCVTLVTTRRRNLLPAADMVEVDMMEEDEAAILLVRESGDLAKSLSPASKETRSVVRECANHPLAVKSVGRWLNLKHATSGEEGDPEQLHKDVVQSMEKILKNGADDDADMMYEILNMSLSPAINGEPTSIIKFCFAAYVHVFCDKEYISDFALADATPIVPLGTVEMLFEALLGLEEETLLKEGSLFYAQKKDAAVLIPNALASLGVFKVITTVAGGEDGEEENSANATEEKYLQIMHVVQQEYGEYLLDQDISLRDLSVDAEKRWNKAIAKAYLATKPEWDSDTPDASLDYFLEMMPVHLIRGEMLKDAANLLCSPSFVKGRLFALGRENGTRRHIKDCETLYDLLMKKKATRKKYEPKATMRDAYETLGDHLNMDEDEFIKEEGSPEAVEVGRCRFEIGFSLAEKRIWEGAIEHWEASQELLVSALGMVEVVAGILYNIGVVYTEMNEYEQALGSLKQCLRVRGTIHGEEHILYAQTIQRIGDVFLSMSDYHEAMESYNWALDVMHIEPSHHRIDIGDILENMGKIHFYKGETDDALQCFHDALQSKQTELGEDHPELFSIYEQIGNCLSEQGKVEDAIAHLEEAIRLKTLDQYGGDERDATVMTLQGVLSVRQGKQKAGLECYEKALQILVTKAPHRKEKIASLLHLIASVYLVGGESKKAMKLFEESLQARRKVLGFVHLDVASTLFSMAYLHQKRKRLDKALKCLEEALKIRQLRLPDSEKVAVTHEKIGTIARSIGKLKKAENAFSEALRIRKLIHGDSHPAVAKVMQDLGDLMDDLGEYEEAMRNYREAYRIRKSFGGDTLPVAETLYTIGFTYSNSGHYEKALECLDAALKIQRLHLGEDAPECGDTLNMIGFLKAKCGQVDESQEYLRDALRIRKLQGDSIKISETLKNIGNAHRSKQEYRSAMETYQECLKIRQKNLGREHDKVADALVAIGNIFADLSRPKEAMDAYQEALGIRARLFGDLDASLAPILQAMGMLDFYGNNYDRSLQLLNDYISIRNGNKGARDGDYVNVLFTIGNIYQLRHDEERAKKAWTEAYETFKDLGLAESNPEHAEQMEKLMRDHGLAFVVEVSSQDDFGDEPSMRQKKGGGVLGRLKHKVKRGDGQSGIRRRGKQKGQQL